MKPAKTLGIVGVTGLVGQTALDLLETCNFKFSVKALKVFASRASIGKVIQFGQNRVVIEEPNLESLLKCDAVLFASDASVSREFIPVLAERGIFCVDKSSAFRMDPKVPLVVPEVNASLLQNSDHSYLKIIASPNCVAIPLVVFSNFVRQNLGLKRMIVSTYQSVSGTGKVAMELLLNESKEFLNAQDLTCTKSSVYPKSIAFNVMPFIESIDEQGHTGEEIKIRAETQKILDIPSLPLDVTSVRVPTFVGHALSVTFETEKPFEKNAFMKLLNAQKGIKIVEDPDIITPREVQGKNEVFVSRIRSSNAFEKGLSAWIACDNLRKGAALNALQIIETLLTRNI